MASGDRSNRFNREAKRNVLVSHPRCNPESRVCPREAPPRSNGTTLWMVWTISRHGGACPRRAMFNTRTCPNARLTPPRSLPPWGDVPWRHRSTRTSPVVAKSEAIQQSGCEHSSTEASSAVGGRPSRGLKSQRKPLSSCHSAQHRLWLPFECSTR